MHLSHFLFEAFLPGQFSPAEQPAHFAPLFFALTRCAIAVPAITSKIPITIQSAKLKSAILYTSLNCGRLTAFPELFVQNYFIMFSYLFIRFTTKITTPNMVSTTPVARFNVAALALLANFAAILAHKSVNTTQRTRQSTSGIPPIAK